MTERDQVATAVVWTPGARVTHERDPERPGTVEPGGIDNLVAVRWGDGFAFLYPADLLRRKEPDG